MELLLPVSKGIASYVPGLYALRSRRRHLQTANAKYCYEVWIKHLTMLNEHDSVPAPKTFAELGPGGSLGVGLAALLSGADTYYALDIIKYSEVDLSLALLRGLVDLFRNRTPVYTGWPIDAEVFPGHILTDDLLEATLAEPRIEEIHRALTAPDGRAGSITIKYTVPWTDPSVIRRGEVDLIISQAVLEHVDDLENTYDAFAQWLRPGGRMSHEIDFRSHGLTRPWNGHWEYPELVWRVIIGKKPYVINRQPCTTHVSLMRDRGFEVTRELRQRIEGIPRERLASRWRDMTDDDLVSATALVQARLKGR
jgi:SAM-dependent methyltransferase